MTAPSQSSDLDAPVRSPCTSVCVLDPEHRVCIGCYRTIDEIASWGSASDDAKRAILAQLPTRRASLGGRSP